MAGRPMARAKAEAAAKVAEPVPAFEPEPFIEAEPLEGEAIEPVVEPVVEPEFIEPEPLEDEPTIVKPGARVMYFDVPHPGFIPEGFEIKGVVSGSATVVRGFIPDPDPRIVAAKAANPDLGKCPYCDYDGSSKANPELSLKGHLRAKHN